MSDGTSKRSNCKLFIGNLDRRIREIHILNIFKKFGEIKGLNFMFHKHGPNKGEPRGFLFLEYSSEEEAERAIRCMNGKMALGRRLVVNKAMEKTAEDFYADVRDSGAVTKQTSSSSSTPSFSTSSAVPSASVTAISTQGASSEEKIRAVQSKLGALEREEKYGEQQHSQQRREVDRNKTATITHHRHERGGGSSSSSSSSREYRDSRRYRPYPDRR